RASLQNDCADRLVGEARRIGDFALGATVLRRQRSQQLHRARHAAGPPRARREGAIHLGAGVSTRSALSARRGYRCARLPDRPAPGGGGAAANTEPDVSRTYWLAALGERRRRPTTPTPNARDSQAQ